MILHPDIVKLPQLTFVIGPLAELGDLVLHPDTVELPAELPPGLRLTKPDMDWLTPSAKINCSRSSRFVLPLAVINNKIYISLYHTLIKMSVMS